MKLNWSTFIGLVVSLALLFGTVLVSAEDSAAFLNLPGLLMVLLGIAAATLISYPMGEVVRIFSVLGIVMREDDYSADHLVEEMAEIARLRQKGSLRQLEDKLKESHNPFFRTGMQLVIDGTPQDEIISLLEWRIMRMQSRENADAQLFHSMSHYAPAFGMFGTLVGLVNMLFAIGPNADIAIIGTYMGIALMTTLYGILLANLVFKPVALKMERRTEARVMLMNMALEGVLLVREKISPSLIRQTLRSYVANIDDELKGRLMFGDEPDEKAA